jgi:multidrug efflux pump subunit AcrB
LYSCHAWRFQSFSFTKAKGIEMGHHSQQNPEASNRHSANATWGGAFRISTDHPSQPRIFLGMCQFALSLAIVTAASFCAARADDRDPGFRAAPESGQEASKPGDEKLAQRVSVTVTAVYPHANAEGIAGSVAAPIELSVKNLPGLESRRSWCGSDGSYRLDLRFARGADERAVLQQIREALDFAKPVLPADVQKAGLGLKRTPASPAVLVTVQATDNLRTSTVLANYLKKVVEPRLSQLRGVSELSVIGAPEFRQRVHIDFDKMRARSVGFAELAGAIESQQSAGTQVTPESVAKVEDGIVKTTPQGQPVQVKDIARVETGVRWPVASLNSKPVIALAVQSTPGANSDEIADSVRKEVVKLGREAPEGITIGLAIDFSQDCQPDSKSRLLIVDCWFPDSSSADQIGRRLQKCAQAAGGVAGVISTFASSQQLANAKSRNASMLIRYASAGDPNAAREKLAAALVGKLRAADPDIAFHVCEWTATGPKHAVSLALLDEGDLGNAALQTWADACLTYLKTEEPMLGDPFSSFPAPTPSVRIDIDRAKLAALGIAFNEIQAALVFVLGNDAEEYRGKVKELKDLKLLNQKGMEIPLGTVITVREVLTSSLIQRIDGYPAALLHASVRAGSKRPDLGKLAERVAKEVKLPTGFRLVVIEE